MATIRMATGNVLGTIADTANAVSSVVNTVAGGAAILNDYVTRMRDKGRESSLVEMISFRDNLINDASLDAVKREENIRAYIAGDEGRQTSFNNFSKKLEEAFQKYDQPEITE